MCVWVCVVVVVVVVVFAVCGECITQPATKERRLTICSLSEERRKPQNVQEVVFQMYVFVCLCCCVWFWRCLLGLLRTQYRGGKHSIAAVCNILIFEN
jgi:hypothetical protein